MSTFSQTIPRTITLGQHVHFFSAKIFWVNVLVGIAFFFVNFPSLIQSTIAPTIQFDWARSLLVIAAQRIGDISSAASGPNGATFERIMSANFLGFGLYIILVIALCMLRLRVRPVVFAVMGFIAGLYVVHFLSWGLISLMWAANQAVWLFGVISHAAAWLINFIFRDALAFFVALSIATYLYFNRQRLLQAILGLVIIAAVGAAIYYWAPPIFAFVSQLLLAFWGWLGSLLAPIIQFLGMIFGPIIGLVQWLVTHFFAPIFGFLFAIAAFVFVVAIAASATCITFASMGNLVTDQLRAAFRVRRIGIKDHGLNGFALGSALALVLLTGVAVDSIAGNISAGWTNCLGTIDFVTKHSVATDWLGSIDIVGAFAATMPKSVHTFVSTSLGGIQAPIVDAAILSLLLIVSCTMVFSSLFKEGAETEQEKFVTFFPLEVVVLLFWIIISLFLLFIQAQSQS